MFSTKVTLPRSQSVKFPEWCIVCSAPHPKDELRVHRIASPSWWTLLVPFVHWFSFLDGQAVHVPACTNCARRLHFQATWRWLVLLFVIAVYAWFALDVAALWLPPLLEELVVVIGALVFIVPWWIWQELRPLAFDMSVSADEVAYLFRDAETARVFRSMNPRSQ